MTKFIKCVNWSVVVEAEQAMELIRAHWAPMDVEDALELVRFLLIFPYLLVHP